MADQILMQYILSALNLAGLMALIAVASISTYKSISRGIAQNIIFGLILGIGAALISAQPIMHINGLQIDPRNLFVGCAAAIFGPLAGLIAFIIAALTRYLEAAPTAYVCIFSLFVAGCCGLAWRSFMEDKRTGHPQIALLGLTISISYVSTFLLPREYWAGVFFNAIPVLVLINIIGSLVLGNFLKYFQDQQDREAHLVRQACFDPLTGLLNRRAFDEAYDALFQSSQTSMVAFVVLDIDDFKAINDQHGHSVGDEIIVALARIVKENFKDNALAGRFGGDEFMICLISSDFNEASLLLRELQKNVAEFNHQKLTSSLTVSIGAIWSEEPLPFSMAFHYADSALHAVKKSGKNQIIIHMPETRPSVSSGKSFEPCHVGART